MRSILRWAGLVLAAVICVAVVGESLILFGGNFHTVVAGELYRSAQPSPVSLASYKGLYGLKTVINLRGAKPGEGWYDDEVAATAALGLLQIDFQMSSDQRLTTKRAQELVAILKDAPKPILIHCQAGADRTGLVSVIYANQIAGVDEEEAEWQLSLLYGHIGIPILSPTFAMDDSWEDLEVLFGIEKS